MTSHDRAPALLTVDLDAIVANWRAIAARAPGAEAAAVVKADAYGLGAGPVARALEAAGCRTFFVATIDEGIDLRADLPDSRILALGGPLPGTAADMAAHDLIPVLNSLEQVGQWVGLARASEQELEAVLHLDTGMSRLGLDQAAIADLADNPAMLGGIRTTLVMSHMACADEPEHPKNREQLKLFTDATRRLGLAARLSLAASSTVFLGPDYHFDLVRPGAALYGLNPVPGQPNPLTDVVRLEARILQVRDVDSPQTVGYGATHRFTGKTKVAVVAAGYADGLFRSLGNRGFGMIGGVRVPVVGRISMDLTTFDVSAVAPELARPGALIELIGASHPADELAAEAGTIGYEVLTALGRRYHRTYVGDDA
ncbi:Alanine racemase [Magnetospirillum sp. LM-5]|uniref:alanine racemase n=1 Tax=Magnetospirillum sp. LM-5 TaxID=2681466 RepID=UPI0013850C9F|nr:alanine racemase [Magnetospirillum sp. LM-5]CAA7611615.1 Alanine racemase [Magnetospirillum sp. LM-5]